MNFSTSNMAKYSPGSYQVTLRGTVGSETKISEDVTFTLVLENPCPTSPLSVVMEIAFDDISYRLGSDQIGFSLNLSELAE